MLGAGRFEVRFNASSPHPPPSRSYFSKELCPRDKLSSKEIETGIHRILTSNSELAGGASERKDKATWSTVNSNFVKLCGGGGGPRPKKTASQSMCCITGRCGAECVNSSTRLKNWIKIPGADVNGEKMMMEQDCPNIVSEAFERDLWDAGKHPYRMIHINFRARYPAEHSRICGSHLADDTCATMVLEYNFTYSAFHGESIFRDLY